MWTLLAVACKEKQRCIVLLREEFKGGSVFEGVDRIAFGESDGIGDFQRIEVCGERCEKGGSLCTS